MRERKSSKFGEPEEGLGTLDSNFQQSNIEHRNTQKIVCMEPRRVTGGLPDGRSALALPEGTEGFREYELWGPNVFDYHA